jgi:predicted transcriptional regulator
MNQKQYNFHRTTVGIGMYRNTPIGNVPLSYLFYLRNIKASLFKYEKQNAIVEIALRRNMIRVSPLTIRAIEILDKLDKSTGGLTVHQLATDIQLLDSLVEDILESLCKNGCVVNELSTYRIHYALDDLSLRTINNMFTVASKDKTINVQHVIRKRINKLFGNMSIRTILDDCSCHQHWENKQ